MIRVLIDTDAPYEALVGRGLLADLGALIARVHAPSKAAVITDRTVGALYGQKALQALEQAGFSPALFEFPAGEEYKTLSTYADAQAFLIGMGLTRSDIVVTMGGGVAGDLGGFAAATYQRGVPFIQVPTTLLCAVDASVGGKTAVDMPGGKNMVGAFHQPSLVVCDTDTFSSLPENRLADGAAEALKHGLIANEALFDRMRDGSWHDDMEAIVARNIEIKRSFVVGDEKDRGMRQMLNFGHTLGHAVETLSGYALSHGQAVALGMVMETRAANRMGFGCADEDKIARALEKNGLMVSCGFSADDVLKTALHDKKRAGDQVVVAALEKIGKGRLKALPLGEFERYVRLGVEA